MTLHSGPSSIKTPAFIKEKAMLSQGRESRKILNKKGQVSVFLGICTLVIIGLLAFIVNIGLYVKARIQLQNAVDAAAYAGASVQARQLTQLSYLNWEMRNTYKEWMFKYYVLGQASLPATYQSNLDKGPKKMNFRRRPFTTDETQSLLYGKDAYNKFNAPSICIAFTGEKFNICGVHTAPGLPRFEVEGVPGLSELAEATLNSFVKTATLACSERSTLNFAAALTWAYGTGKAAISEAPSIAANRIGAWPQALELGLRMRNLEMIMNRPPVSAPICIQGSSCTSLEQLRAESPLPINMRSIKAFESAWRNLGGPSPANNELQDNFELTEISPQGFQAGSSSVSGMLIPGSASIGQTGVSPLTKHYLDIQLYPLNLVTFFTTFASTTKTTKGGTDQQGNCGSSLTALPVPAYLFGFVKNPEVLTYYAVKGTSKFKGLFYPFKEDQGITITAYASAKPFGGRIGPRLFSFKNNNQAVSPRTKGETRTAPYISGFDTSSLGAYIPGDPIPSVANFWVRKGTSIGGIPQGEVRFGIPNLLYDFGANVGSIANQSYTADTILSLQPAPNMIAAETSNEELGLYDVEQFRLFSGLINNDGGAITSELVGEALRKVRSPTRYEALNYLIPTTNNIGMEAPDSAVKLGNGINGAIIYDLYAPLFGPGTLYQDINSLEEIVTTFIDSNQNAIKTFELSLKEVADNIRSQNTGELDSSGDNLYAAAANAIYPKAPLTLDDTECENMSLAGRFHHFFGKTNGVCQIIPLIKAMKKYFSDSQGKNSSYKNRYQAEYLPAKLPNSSLMTGYMPGPRHGSTQEGELNHPFRSDLSYISRRNYYSTKLVAIEKLIGSNFSYLSTSPYREKIQGSATDLNNLRFKNALDPSELNDYPTLDN